MFLAQREFLQKIYHSIHLPWISTLLMIDSGDKGTVSYLRFESELTHSQRLTAISVNQHRNKAPGVTNKIEPLACDDYKQGR